MIKRILIILLAVLLAAAALYFFVLRDAEQMVSVSEDGIFTYSYQENENGIKFIIEGSFPTESWVAQSADEQIAAVKKLRSGKKEASYLIQSVEMGVTSISFLLDAPDDENNGYQIVVNVSVNADGKISLDNVREREGNVQNFSGSTDEFAYICTVGQNLVRVELSSTQISEWNYEIENDAFLTIERITQEDEATATDRQSVHYTLTAAGYGEKELVRFCASGLSKALEITVSADDSGAVKVTDLQPVAYDYYEMDDETAARIEAYQRVGQYALPTTMAAREYDILRAEKEDGTSFTVTQFVVTVGGKDWIYWMTEDATPDDLMKICYERSNKQVQTVDGVSVEICSDDSVMAAAWQWEHLGCLVARYAETIYDENTEEKTDGVTEILLPADALTVVSAAVAELRNAGTVVEIAQ